jgi:hypothetical protein
MPLRSHLLLDRLHVALLFGLEKVEGLTDQDGLAASHVAVGLAFGCVPVASRPRIGDLDS